MSDPSKKKKKKKTLTQPLEECRFQALKNEEECLREIKYIYTRISHL
jgi:hypothetical protein